MVLQWAYHYHFRVWVCYEGVLEQCNPYVLVCAGLFFFAQVRHGSASTCITRHFQLKEKHKNNQLLIRCIMRSISFCRSFIRITIRWYNMRTFDACVYYEWPASELFWRRLLLTLSLLNSVVSFGLITCLTSGRAPLITCRHYSLITCRHRTD